MFLYIGEYEGKNDCKKIYMPWYDIRTYIINRSTLLLVITKESLLNLITDGLPLIFYIFLMTCYDEEQMYHIDRYYSPVTNDESFHCSTSRYKWEIVFQNLCNSSSRFYPCLPHRITRHRTRHFRSNNFSYTSFVHLFLISSQP